jgi:hypothetical protein
LKALKLLVVLTVVMVASFANANTMTFAPATTGVFMNAPYTEDGIKMTLLTGHYDVFGCTAPGTDRCGNIDDVSFGPATVKFTLAGGGTFSLDKIFLPLTDQIATITSSTGASQTLTAAGGYVIFSGADWSGISSFTLATINSSFFEFADVTINTAQTPEPASIALLASGLAGLARFIRRKR